MTSAPERNGYGGLVKIGNRKGGCVDLSQMQTRRVGVQKLKLWRTLYGYGPLWNVCSAYLRLILNLCIKQPVEGQCRFRLVETIEIQQALRMPVRSRNFLCSKMSNCCVVASTFNSEPPLLSCYGAHGHYLTGNNGVFKHYRDALEGGPQVV